MAGKENNVMLRPIFALLLALTGSIGGLTMGVGQTNAPKAKTETGARKPSLPAKRPPDSPKSTPPRSALLTGKAFAITKGGDLKPARLASVFVLSGDAALQFKDSMASIQSKAAEAESRLRQPLDSDGTPLPGFDVFLHLRRKDICLESYINTLRSVIDLAKQNPDSAVTSDTDEEGLFRVTGLKPGMYTVIVVGRAGANFSVWTRDVSLEAGKEQALKLHSPSIACFDL